MAGLPCSGGCGRRTRRPAWPEGTFCATCAVKRLRRRGHCARCAQLRSLPVEGDGQGRLCLACGGVHEDLRCRSCGARDDFHTTRQCRRCGLKARLERLFNDGTGHIDSRLVRLFDALVSMQVPAGGLSWLESAAVVGRIRAVATGQVPLTHAGIDQLPASNGREHLRELLIVHGALPARSRYMAAYERWALRVLDGIAEPVDRRVIAAFLCWHVRPGLERLDGSGQLTESRYSGRRAQTNIAVHLLTWLRSRDEELSGLTQASIDVWFSDGPGTRRHARAFLGWAIKTRRAPAVTLPPEGRSAPHVLPESHRLELLSRLLSDDSVELVDRVAGCLVLLYALPASRMHRLQLSDLEPGDDDGLMIRIGADPIPVPEPLHDLLTELIGHRSHLTGATHSTGSHWLFPGKVAGQPMEPDQLAERLNRLGINRAARTAALNALVRDVPAPVVAKVLNRRPWRVADRAKTLGTDWAHYASLKARG